MRRLAFVPGTGATGLRAAAWIAAVLAPAVVFLAADAASAQHVIPSELPAAYGYHVASLHAHGTAVAVALRVRAGSQNDAAGLEGTAWLLARVLEDQVAEALGTTPALFTASVERATTVFTLVAEPAAWASAWRTADSVVFQAPLDPRLVERQRSALLQPMAFESGSPAREFEAAAAALLAEPGSPWARPPQGTPESLRAVDAPALERFRAQHLRRDTGAWALVGPASLKLPPTSPPPAPPPPPDAPWRTGERVVLARDVTSTWIAVAYPASPDLPRTHLELLGHLLREELDPLPPAPDRYDVVVSIEETPGGPALVVEASVMPEASAAWEARILGAVERLATDAPAEDFFRWRRRRFRAERLLDESAPCVEAERITADLLRGGRARDLGVEIWQLDGQALLRSARSLGPPRILVFGPDLGQDGSRAGG
jgi:hypothetical protein